jgi:membrane protease YdiL (CAAX protease family)
MKKSDNTLESVLPSLQDSNREIDIQRKTFRVVGVVMFLVCLGLVVLRTSITLLARSGVNVDYAEGYLLDTIFGLCMQVGVMLILPWCVYRYALHKSPIRVLRFGNVHKVGILSVLISILIGLCCFVVTIGISLLWQIFIGALGYQASPNSMPQASVGGLMLSLLLVGVLPSLCEEWTFRGGLLSTLESVFGRKRAIVIGAIIFGLFHQNITQVFYTTMIGMLLTYLTLLTRSIWPAVIIHFVNNGMSTYLSYANGLGWFGQGFFDLLNANLVATGLVFVIVGGIGTCLVVIMHKVNTDNLRIQPKINNNLMLNLATVAPVILPSTVLTGTPEVIDPSIDEDRTIRFKPVLQDYAFYIGAGVVVLLSTVFSFVYGLY